MRSAYELDSAGNWTRRDRAGYAPAGYYDPIEVAPGVVIDHDDPRTETWTTRTVTIETARGLRYQGVSYVGTGRPTYGPLPKRVQIRYRTRLLRSFLNAAELARSRTIHHNLYHAGNASGHLARYCKEG